MLGLINDCTEQLVVSKFGVEAWHAIKASAGCDVKDGGFVKHEPYPDSATIDIVVAAAGALGVEVDDVLELFGRYFLEYTRANGYDNLLKCQGSTLRLWLSSLNALHDHLQSSLPTGNFPVFWCEDDDDRRGSIMLHYYSVRGALLAQLVVGLVSEIAILYFDVEINMERLETQGEDEAKCTTWRISAVDPEKAWKVTGVADSSSDAGSIVDRAIERRKLRGSGGGRGSSGDLASQAESGVTGTDGAELRCPFTGNAVNGGERPRRGMSRVASDVSLRSLLSMNTAGTGPTLGTTISVVIDEEEKEGGEGCPGGGGGRGIVRRLSGRRNSGEKDYARSRTLSSGSNGGGVRWDEGAAPPAPSGGNDASNSGNKSTKKKKDLQSRLLAAYDFGLPSSKVRQIFPYHIMLDKDFRILQVGRRLPEILGWDEKELVGRPIVSVLRIVKPVLAAWDWPMMQKLHDQTFFLAPVTEAQRRGGNGNGNDKSNRRSSLVSFKSWRSTESDGSAGSKNKDGKGKVRAVPEATPHVRFKGSVVQVSRHKAILVLSPDAANISELSAMGLTMSDLPLHSFQRDSVFLGEHIASEVRSAHKLDKLSKRLDHEKTLSNTLLNNMLPPKVADDLRAGKTVEPTHFENVTLFFSDVVGFTTICDSIEPWDVIDMLNQLYSVMDYLSSHFKLYKVETVGDAYMCCSGLPVADERHAENVANYALAVRECVKMVLNPADGTPLQLRIGIHTGHCMGGVVGTLTPHYCLFGDMVNTTARHESTGMAEKIQASSVLYGRLKHFAVDEKEQYKLTPRGLVSMKGKGECYTYWLDGSTDDNVEASPAAIKDLYKEVGEMLAEEKWKKRRYFRRFTMRDGNSSVGESSAFFQSEANLSSAEGDAAIVAAGFSNDDYDEGGVGCKAGSDIVDTPEESDGAEGRSVRDDLDSILSDDAPLPLTCPHFDAAEVNDYEEDDDAPRPPCKKETWAEVSWCPGLTNPELVAHVHELLLDHFHACLAALPDNLDLLDGQMYGFVRAIAGMYHNANGYHHWRHACHVVLGASHLVDVAGFDREYEPWIGFAAVFAALVHDVKHLGVPNAQLQAERHVLVQVFDDGSCQERQSCHISIKVFIEQFPDLSAEVFRGCPNFLHLVTTAVLATDIGSGEAQKKMRDRFERVVAAESSLLSAGVEEERSQSVLEHVLIFSDVGHCSQGFGTFLRWNKMFYEECLTNFIEGRGDDPRPNWFKGQIGFIQGYILPLAERCERLIIGLRSGGQPKLVEGVQEVLRQWKEKGETWTQETIDEFEGDERWQRPPPGDQHDTHESESSIVKSCLERAPDVDNQGKTTRTLDGSSSLDLESAGPDEDKNDQEEDPTGLENKGSRRKCHRLWDTRNKRIALSCVAVLVVIIVVVAATLGSKAASSTNSNADEAKSTGSGTGGSNATEAIGETLESTHNEPIHGDMGMDQYDDAADAAKDSSALGNSMGNIFALAPTDEKDEKGIAESGAG